jgi:hypothetical protein
MFCYGTLGLRAEAAVTYRRCQATLFKRLGIAVSAKTDALHRSLCG